MLQMFAPAECVVLWRVMLDQMAQLASVAIENSLLYERLAFQAQHDTLTGLANRLLFQDRVQQAARSALRHGKKVAVIWIDLDKYKQINDTLGHRVGDEVLCEVSRRLVSTLRQSDSVARVGGDEFTALVQDVMQPEDAELVAAKILSALIQPFQVSSQEIPISASLGISIFPEHGEDPITLLRHADLAMYSAKRAGGGAFRMFRSALSDSMERRMTIEQELKTALDHKDLTLEYQPLLGRDGNLNGVEALLRWNNRVLGQVSPAEFIPIAEETGLIIAIGEWVTRTACQDGARWLREGYDVPRIAVNVSARQFSDGKFPALVQKILRECGLPASRLELEITETALMDNLALVIDQIEALRKLGLTLCNRRLRHWILVAQPSRESSGGLRQDRPFVHEGPGARRGGLHDAGARDYRAGPQFTFASSSGRRGNRRAASLAQDPWVATSTRASTCIAPCRPRPWRNCCGPFARARPRKKRCRKAH